MGRPVQDLTGKRFGKWTVICRDPARKSNAQGNSLWVCRCICGSESQLPGSKLVSGSSTGCRICAVRLKSGKSNDLTGQTIHGWTIVSRDGRYGSGRSRKVRWNCMCQYGHTVRSVTSVICRGALICQTCKHENDVANPERKAETRTFSAADIAFFTGPIVYAFRKDDRYLYVGMSEHGLYRVFSSVHDIAITAMNAGASLEMFACTSRKDALALERDLIAAFSPEMNIVVPVVGAV